MATVDVTEVAQLEERDGQKVIVLTLTPRQAGLVGDFIDDTYARIIAGPACAMSGDARFAHELGRHLAWLEEQAERR